MALRPGETYTIDIKIVNLSDGDVGGPHLIHTDQLFLGAVRMEEAVQSVDNLNVPIAFFGPAQEPLAEMTFSREDLNAVSVTAFRGDSAADRPELFVPPFPDNRSVRRYYAIAADPPDASFDATMTLYYDQSEFDKSGLPNEVTLKLYRFNGTKWELAGGQVDSANNSVTVPNVKAFSFWAFAETAGLTTSVQTEALPENFSLRQNYPNPLHLTDGQATATIEFFIPEAAPIQIAIFSLTGQKVRTLFNGKTAAGPGKAIWDGTDDTGNNVPSGIYFYQLVTPHAVQTKKLVLMR